MPPLGVENAATSAAAAPVGQTDCGPEGQQVAHAATAVCKAAVVAPRREGSRDTVQYMNIYCCVNEKQKKLRIAWAHAAKTTADEGLRGLPSKEKAFFYLDGLAGTALDRARAHAPFARPSVAPLSHHVCAGPAYDALPARSAAA